MGKGNKTNIECDKSIHDERGESKQPAAAVVSAATDMAAAASAATDMAAAASAWDSASWADASAQEISTG